MSVQEIETAITQLPAADFEQLSEWFAEFQADAWDRQIERDVKTGRLDALARQADAAFEAGRYRPL